MNYIIMVILVGSTAISVHAGNPALAVLTGLQAIFYIGLNLKEMS